MKAINIIWDTDGEDISLPAEGIQPLLILCSIQPHEKNKE